jgi:hypothetical protein
MLNSALAFILIYVVIVDESSKFLLIIPWVLGDVLAGQLGIRLFKGWRKGETLRTETKEQEGAPD